jgi:hypothetical protein
MGRRNRKVSEGSRVEAGTHRSESREISIPSAVGISGPQAGEDVNGLIDEVIGWFREHPDLELLRPLFGELVRQAITGLDPQGPVPTDLMEMKTMLATQGAAWKREWLAEGRAEGQTEGKIESLVRLLVKRFGPLEPALQARIRAADRAAIENWFDRAIDAPDLTSVFEPPR